MCTFVNIPDEACMVNGWRETVEEDRRRVPLSLGHEALVFAIRETPAVRMHDAWWLWWVGKSKEK